MSKTYKQIRANEEVILALQDHWVALMKPFLLILISWSIFAFLYYIALLLRPVSDITGYLLLFIGCSFLIICHHLFIIFIFEWLISNIIVTNRRIIELRYFPFVLDDVVYIEISSIHEMEKKKHGIIKNLLNYGDIIMNLTGIKKIHHLEHVKKPSKIINLIQTIKFQNPKELNLEELDLKGIGATYSSRYKFLS